MKFSIYHPGVDQAGHPGALERKVPCPAQNQAALGDSRSPVMHFSRGPRLTLDRALSAEVVTVEDAFEHEDDKFQVQNYLKRESHFTEGLSPTLLPSCSSHIPLPPPAAVLLFDHLMFFYV